MGGLELTDIQSLRLQKEIFRHLNRSFQTKLPLDSVDVVDHSAKDDLCVFRKEWACTKKLDGQRCLVYGRVAASGTLPDAPDAPYTPPEIQLFVVYPDGTAELLETIPDAPLDLNSFLFDAECLGDVCYLFGTYFANACVVKTEDLAVQLCIAGLLLEKVPALQQHMTVKPFFEVQTAQKVLLHSFSDLPHDGLVFTRQSIGCFRSIAQHIKWKPRHMLTVDFELNIAARDDTAGGSSGGLVDLLIDGRVESSINLMDLTPGQQTVIREMHAKQVPCIAEMAPSLSCQQRAAGSHPIGRHPIEWTLVRFRPDKIASNYTSVYERNRRLFLDFIPLEHIVSTDTPSYWKRKETLGKRAVHPLRHMRNFHNACKGHVYQTVFGALESVFAETEKGIHLELGYGRGGDTIRLQTYLPCTYNRIIALDNDANALREAQRRWYTSNTSCASDTSDKKRNYTDMRYMRDMRDMRDMREDIEPTKKRELECYVCDLAENRDVDDLLRNDLRDVQRVQSLVAHFSIHYFKRNFEFLCDTLVEVGGTVGITMFCRKRVQALLDANGGQVQFFHENEQGNEQGKPMIELREGPSPDTVDVYIDSIGQWHTEELYDPHRLLSDDFKIVDSFFFDQRRGHRQYNASSKYWPFTSLYQAVVFKRERWTYTDVQDVNSESTGFDSVYGSGSGSPVLPASPAYREHSPVYEPDLSDYEYYTTHTNRNTRNTQPELYSPDFPVSPPGPPASPYPFDPVI